MARHNITAVMCVSLASLVLAGCGSGDVPNGAPSELDDFQARYTAAWSSQDPARVASHVAQDGALTINDGPPSIGRDAVTEAARGFMTAFPDMVVAMDSLRVDGVVTRYYWTLTGTNTGPGGGGRAIRISGFEEWTLTPDGLIGESRGHFDEAEYRRQLAHGIEGS